MNLKDFKNKHVNYDWKTIFIGIQECFFSKDVISEYAVELIVNGAENEFVSELAWGVSSGDIDKVMLEIKTNYFPQLNEDSTILVEEYRKLRFIYLSKLKDEYKEDAELLNEIAVFYGNHRYPEDMVNFVNYMPQEVPTTKVDLVNRFDEFLKFESVRFR